MALDFGKLNFSTSFNPTSAFPLDARCYFESLTLAEEAAATAAPAGDTNTVYYYGMTLCVVENEAATLYIIQPDKTLEEVGSVPVGDGLSIEVVDGEIKIKGFGDKYYAYVPAVKDEETGAITTPSSYEEKVGFKAGLEPRIVLNDKSEYEIAWYEPSTETIDGVNTKVDAVVGTVDTIEGILNGDGTEENPGVVKEVDELQESVATVEQDVAALEEKVGIDGVGEAATGLYKEIDDLTAVVDGKVAQDDFDGLEERVATAEGEIDQLQIDVANKANSADVYTKGEVDTAVGAKANSADVYTKEQTYTKDEVDGLVGAKANASDVYTKTEADGLLDDKANAADVYTKTEVYTKEETATEIGKAVAAVDHLKRVIVESTDAIDIAAEDAMQFIYMVKKQGAILGDTYDEYMVVEVEGQRSLERVGDWKVDLSEYAKTADVTETLKDYAKSTDVYTKTEVDGLFDAKADAVYTKDEVNGLVGAKADASALDGKVDKVDGMGLSHNDFTDELAEKLNGIAVGAEVNVVKSVDEESGLALSEAGALGLGSVAQDKVTGLAEALASKVDAEEGKSLVDDGLITKLQGIAEGAQVNVLEGVQVNGVDLSVDESKKVNIPLAGVTAGTVVSSDESGKVKVETDGTMKVNNLDISLLTQSEDLILDGGSSGASIYE